MLLHFNFDLDIGAVLDKAHPPDSLSALEEKDLRNLAFPEVCSTSLEDSQMFYTFRLRQKQHDADVVSLRHLSASQFHFSFGYVLFRKRKDETSKRGWFQESFVIVSELNLTGFFYRLCEVIADCSDSQAVFESLYNLSINEWPWPTPGT